MACFACFLLFVAVNVAADSTTSENNNITTIIEPNVVHNSTAEDTRAVPVKPIRSTGKEKLKPASNATSINLQKEFEQKLVEKKQNREVSSVPEFWARRTALAESEVEVLFGNRMPLGLRELKANRIVLSKKYLEYNADVFPPAQSFFDVKPLIDQSEIFQIIRKVPKGGTLYSILIAAVPLSFMYDLTFEDNLYFAFQDVLLLKFAQTAPGVGWRLLSEIRATENLQFFADLNQEVLENLSVIPNAEFPEDTPSFRQVLHVYSNLTSYRPILERVFVKALEVLYEDNVMYADFYYHFPEVYDLDGRIYTPNEVALIFKRLLSSFISTHPDFMGIRIVYSPLERLSDGNIGEFRSVSTNLWRTHPGLVAGFGVVIMEADEEPYSNFVEEFLKFPRELKLFLDAGVTNDWGVDADYNLLDAVVLNSAAIAAAVALPKHPVVLEKLREKNIPVKSCPTASQILGLVPDLRTHPLTVLVATDFPIAIVNVGGTAWNATGLSYDWYEAYLAMTPRFCDLRCLKQFAVNSLMHSNLSVAEKKRSLKLWQKKWDEFIKFVLDNYDV